MVKDKRYYDFLEEAYKRNANGVSWSRIAEDFITEFGEYISRSGMRHRTQDYAKKIGAEKVTLSKNVSTTFNGRGFIQYNSDGSVEAQKIIDCDEHTLQEPNKLLEKLGYEPSQWEIVSYRVSEWNSGSDEEGNLRTLHAVQYKIKPRTQLSPLDMVNAVREAFKCEIEPLSIAQRTHDDSLDDSKLMEIAPIELHMGKLAHEIESGENYDLKIAQRRFYDIIEEIVERQTVEQCGKCVLVIGSDFFNSESDNCTSVNKIPQQNDTRYVKLFIEGITMYTSAILTLREHFNHIDVMLCAGNHARAMETFLYIALQQRFIGDGVVNFIENYRQTQAYVFGQCAIFFNHGDANLKQTIKSIPAEFAKIWGTHPYRELHLGHLHKEVTVDDEGGMITRRIGSPCSTDAWHYSNRFVGAVKKHQVFIWNKNYGLTNVHYIPIIE